MEDNLYKNSTAFFLTEPDAQKSESEKEKELVTPYVPILQQIVDRLKERITFYDSVKAIKVDPSIDPKAHQVQVLANQQTVQNLEQEFLIISDLIADHTK